MAEATAPFVSEQSMQAMEARMDDWGCYYATIPAAAANVTPIKAGAG